MAIQLMSLPQVQVQRQNMLLDTAPLERGLDVYRKGVGAEKQETINRLIGKAYNESGPEGAGKVAAQEGRTDETLQFKQADQQDQIFRQQKQDRAIKTLAGLSQMIQEAPEDQRVGMWQRVRAMDKDTDKDLTAMGIDPNDYMAATQMIISRAQGYRDPLAIQDKKSEIDARQAQAYESRSKGDYYRSGGPAAKAPSGYRYNETAGAYEFVPGGPADPATIAAQTASRGRGRQFSVADTQKLTQEGSSYAAMKGFNNTFNDQYAGYTFPGSGGVALTLGDSGYGTENQTAGAKWWRDYQAHKNEVRHGMFGASLTPGEAREFDKMAIDPSMDPKQIRYNLNRQQQIMRSAMMRTGNALAKGKYDPEVIQNAYGISLDGSDMTPEQQAAFQQFQAEITGKPQGQVPPQQPSPQAAPQAAPGAAPQGGVDPDAINILRSAPPEQLDQMKAYFDEIFGPGAADRALDGQ
jgi:hypothetical protein